MCKAKLLYSTTFTTGYGYVSGHTLAIKVQANSSRFNLQFSCAVQLVFIANLECFTLFRVSRAYL